MYRRNFALIAVASVLALGLSSSIHAAELNTPTPVPVLANCTPQNSPLEVIAGTCKLVKGVALYGDNLASLSGILDGMVPSAGGTGVTGGF